MIDELKEKITQKIDVDFGLLAFVLWTIAFWGEPDLVDALIHFLMRK